MLRVDRTEYQKYVFSKINERKWTLETVIPYESQPFCHINYIIGKTTGEQGWLKLFSEETMRYRREASFSADGAITLNDKNIPGRPMLVDLLQDYASRLAQTSAITGDKSLSEDCVEQFRIYHHVLCDQKTGLYSQGRGFLPDPAKCSPGAWSRGHGWLMRGMVESLDVIPRNNASYAELLGYLHELANALLAVQDQNGMWHQLLHLPFEDSYPETSGSALIAAYLAKAWRLKLLPDLKYRDAALRAFRSVAKQVDERGTIAGTCKGPGPLRSIDDYLRTQGEPNDPHGLFAVLFACAEIARMN
jgi:rhamnogalacturonyl hydrolase YesR